MKKIFAIFLGLFIYTNSAWAAFDIVDITPINPGRICAATAPSDCIGGTAGSGCSSGSAYCNNCSGYTTSTSTPQTGVTATTSYEKHVYCVSSSSYNCGCVQTTTYACASGYCGTCTDETDLSTCNCKAIPANGYCSAGEIKCNTGYFKAGSTSGITSCIACTANAVSCTGVTNVTCEKNYYKTTSSGTNMAKCTACPDNTVTASTGATSVAQCYIPAGTTFSDTSGNGKYVTDCYSD